MTREWAEAPYVRVYSSIVTDFGDLYTDDAALAAWLRLLIVADPVWPAPAPLPRWLEDSVLQRLVEGGRIALVGSDHYTVSGLAKEREERRARGVAGGKARAASMVSGIESGPRSATTLSDHAERGAPARRDETSQDEPSNDETSGDAPTALVMPQPPLRRPVSSAVQDLTEYPALQWLWDHNIAMDADGGRMQQKLGWMCELHSSEAVIEQFEKLRQDRTNRTARQFIFGADDLLNPIPAASRKSGDQGHTRTAAEVLDAFAG